MISLLSCSRSQLPVALFVRIPLKRCRYFLRRASSRREMSGEIATLYLQDSGECAPVTPKSSAWASSLSHRNFRSAHLQCNYSSRPDRFESEPDQFDNGKRDERCFRQLLSPSCIRCCKIKKPHMSEGTCSHLAAIGTI